MRRPQCVTALVIALVLTLAGCGGSAELADGSRVQFSATGPRVLIASTERGPLHDVAGVEWSGTLWYLRECDCVVLLEPSIDGAVTFIAWQPGTIGLIDGGVVRVQLPDGRRLSDGEAIAGFGTRATFAGTPPVQVRLPLAWDSVVVADVD
jgi:hypothetical protein